MLPLPSQAAFGRRRRSLHPSDSALKPLPGLARRPRSENTKREKKSVFFHSFTSLALVLGPRDAAEYSLSTSEKRMKTLFEHNPTFYAEMERIHELKRVTSIDSSPTAHCAPPALT